MPDFVLVVTMELGDVADCRLFYQGISSRLADSPERVVSRLGAIQAQDYRAALWAIGLRCKGATIAEVEEAIADRRIVRTWPLRHTLHFVSPLDVRWMLGFYPEESIPKYQKNNGLTEELLETGMRTIAGAFGEKAILTYPELHRALRDTGISALAKSEVRSHIIRRAGRAGLVCFAPHVGGKPAFALLDKWVAGHQHIGREKAAAELSAKYFTSHGPATIRDFMWWSGLRASDAKLGIERCASRLRQESIDGRTYYMPKAKGRVEHSDDAHLLPAFDEYLVSYKDRSAALSNRRTRAVLRSGKLLFTTSNGIFLPTVVIGGQVVGTWKRTRTKGSEAVEVLPFMRFDSWQKARIRDAAGAYGRFVGGELALRFV